MAFLTRTSSYIRPHNVSAIIGAYADADPRNNEGRELIRAVIATIQRAFFSSVPSLTEIRKIPLEETVRVSETTLDFLSLYHSGEEPYENPISDAESPIYPDSYFHLEGLTGVGECLVTRHLSSTRDTAARRCKQIKDIYQDIYDSSCGFILEHIRENPHLCIGRITGLGKQIGEGSRAIVFPVSVDGTEQMVARFEKNTILPDPKQDFLLPTDKSLLRSLDLIKTIQDIPSHPNVMQFEQLVFLKSIRFKPPIREQNEIFGLGFEKINGSTFQKWLEFNSNEPKMILKLFLDFMKGLQHLENAGIPHLDLTKPNLMVREPEKSSDIESGVVIDYLNPRMQPIYPCFFLDTRSSLVRILDTALFKTIFPKEGKSLVTELLYDIQTHKLAWPQIIERLEKISNTYFPQASTTKSIL